MIDLTFVAEDDLWEELKKRSDATLLVTLKNINGKEEASQVFYSGGKFTCVGLAERSIQIIMESMSPSEEEKD